MEKPEKPNWLTTLTKWYFGRNALPYWCVVLADTVIVFVSCLFVYWAFHRTGVAYEHRFEMLYTAQLLALLSWVGARAFRTYSGVVRYSGFVDLLKVCYANALTFILAMGSYYLFKALGVPALTALKPLHIFAALVLSTLLMIVMRMLVKTLYEVTNTGAQAMRVLIYGAMTGGVAVAKSIRAQTPTRFELRGFITHDGHLKGMRMMGVPVYSLDEDLAAIVKKEHIQAVLVSPLRVEEFRENQAVQDILIGAGCKIYMSQQAKEASIKNGVLSDEEVENMQLREVSVEDLLPR